MALIHSPDSGFSPPQPESYASVLQNLSRLHKSDSTADTTAQSSSSSHFQPKQAPIRSEFLYSERTERRSGMSGKYQAYPEYKDSGVEWLGRVPQHWRATQTKYGYT